MDEYTGESLAILVGRRLTSQTVIEQLAELLSQSKFVIATDYRGLSVAEMSELRRQLRNMGTAYHVVKNSLAKFAAENVGKQGLSQLLTGPTALAFGHEGIT